MVTMRPQSPLTQANNASRLNLKLDPMRRDGTSFRTAICSSSSASIRKSSAASLSVSTSGTVEGDAAFATGPTRTAIIKKAAPSRRHAGVDLYLIMVLPRKFRQQEEWATDRQQLAGGHDLGL